MLDSVSPRDALRARTLLLRAEGKTQKETALEVGVTEHAVGHWEKRFRAGGIAGLTDTWGRHRKDPVPAETVRRVLTDSLQPPPNGTHWTLLSMAGHAGISQTQVHRIWSANGSSRTCAPWTFRATSSGT